MTVNKFFVYGSLRPDIKAPWTDIVHNNPTFKVNFYKAHLPYSKLYLHRRCKYPICYFSKAEFTEHDKTIGYILEVDNIESAMKVFDSIEDYPTLYDRKIVECFNEDLEIIDSVYFYTSLDDEFSAQKMVDIEVNDWALHSS
jgi:gamma-glutamylcyclotransferase (GGCT)/AIG2-like uncharacterized protein YtfP